MKAILVRETGGPEVLKFEDMPEPSPNPGQAVIAVKAAGLNFIDTYQRSGAYKVPLPFVLGQEGAGTISALGPGVEDLIQ